ncbi:MAG TPA: HlyD family efflux transporter periplasmic adaptor subunit [Polyangiaceae bacterium]|nr:HlyD family efflux transporter periplasmic adaptor subunit [Polyangiaceae bacterium]
MSVFRVLSAVLVLALVVGAVSVLRPEPIAVDVATTTRGLLELSVVDDCKARIREKYTVSAPVAGTLARIERHEGDVVEPGAELARLLPLASPLLDPESRKSAEQRLASTIDGAEQAKASVARAQALRDQAGADVQRNQALAAQGSLSSAELDRTLVEARTRDADLASARFAQSVAEHAIAEARATLARFRPGATQSEEFELTSPVHGEVLHVFHQSEGVVSAGTPLLEVGDPQALELVADVLSQDAVEIRPGMSARVAHWGGPTPLRAKVRRVEPAAFTKTSALGVDEQRVNVVLDLDGATPGALGDGFAAEVEITVWSKPDAVKIPTSALFRQGGAWAVFVVRGERAHTRAVVPGHRGPLETEVTSGLTPGDVVVIHPGAAVADGSRVTHR